MSPSSRERLALWLPALATAAALLWFGSADVFWSGDFIDEAYPAYVGLQRDGWDMFLERMPGYSGFVILVGAPAALLAEQLKWLDTGLFRLTALPGLAVLIALAVQLGRHARIARRPGWWLVVALAAGGPLGYQALAYGHPEDLLAGGGAVLAVLAALGGRPTAAALLLLLAVVAKQWAVLAILPAVLAAPHGRPRILLIAGAGSAAVVALQLFVLGGAAGTMVNTAGLFHPHAIWWPLGVDAPAAFTAAGHGELTAPAWLQPLTRPILMGVALALTVAWWLRKGRRTAGDVDVLALLALVFALRCALDPWNLVYYQLPLALALLAWETRRGAEWPILTLAVSALSWLSFVTYDARTGMGPFLVYFAWMAPLVGHLAMQLYAQPRQRRAPVRAPLPVTS